MSRYEEINNFVTEKGGFINPEKIAAIDLYGFEYAKELWKDGEPDSNTLHKLRCVSFDYAYNGGKPLNPMHFNNKNITKTEEQLLSHLEPATQYADTYFCGISKTNKNNFIDTIAERTKKWVEKNGGIFKILSDKKYLGERKGYYVKIVFPSYNNTKQIMAQIIEKQKKNNKKREEGYER